jgi:hypothetical protein
MDRLIMQCLESSFSSSLLCPNPLYIWKCLAVSSHKHGDEENFCQKYKRTENFGTNSCV